MSDAMKFSADESIPADVRAIDADVARLAEADRAAALAGLEERLLVTVRSMKPLTAPASRRRVEPAAPAIPWLLRVFTPMRVAAGLALVGALVAVRMASWGGPSGPTVAADSDSDALLVAWSTAPDDGLDSLAQEIDLFLADLVSFDASLSVGDSVDPEGGSM